MGWCVVIHVVIHVVVGLVCGDGCGVRVGVRVSEVDRAFIYRNCASATCSALTSKLFLYTREVVSE